MSRPPRSRANVRPRAQLAERDRQLHGAGIDVGRRGDPVHLVHLQIPGRPARAMVRPRRLEQLDAGTASRVVEPLGIVGADGVARRRHVRHGEHLVLAQGLAQTQPQAARVDRVVDAGQEEAEPSRFLHGVPVLGGEAVGLDEALHLLPGDGVGLEAVDLDRIRSGRQVCGRRRGVEREHVDMGAPVDEVGVDEEEELAAHVVRVVEHERVHLHEALLAGAPAEPELAPGEVALLLGPHPVELDGPHLPRRQEPEVPRRDAFGEEPRGGQVERDVAELDAPQHVVRSALVEDVDVVGGRELAGLVEVDVQPDPLGDRALGPHGELHVGVELGQQVGIARELDPRVARPEPRPVAPELGLPHDLEVEVGQPAGEQRRSGIGRLQGQPGGGRRPEERTARQREAPAQ